MFPPGGPYPHPEPPERREPEPEEQPQTVGEASDIDRISRDPVLAWRAKVAVDAGFTPQQARVIALDRSIDVRWTVTQLIDRGCPVDTAFDIVSS